MSAKTKDNLCDVCGEVKNKGTVSEDVFVCSDCGYLDGDMFVGNEKYCEDVYGFDKGDYNYTKIKRG